MILFDEFLFPNWVGRKPTLPRKPTTAAWGLWLLRHLACLQRLLGWPVEGFDQRTHLGEGFDGALQPVLSEKNKGNAIPSPEKNGGISCSSWIIRTEVLFLLFWGKRKQLNLFLCVFIVWKNLVFFSTRQVGRVPTKSHLDQVSLIPNSDAWWSDLTVVILLRRAAPFWSPSVGVGIFLHTESAWMFPKIMVSPNHPF